MHAIEWKWLALTNISKDYKDIVGFLKISISILHASDKPIELKDDKVTTAIDLKDVNKLS